MPRNEDVFPSRRPRSVPPLIWTIGGFRLGPADGSGAGAAFGFCSPARSPVALATMPPTRAPVVPSICRRFMRLNDDPDASLAMLPLVLLLTWSALAIARGQLAIDERRDDAVRFDGLGHRPRPCRPECVRQPLEHD